MLSTTVYWGSVSAQSLKILLSFQPPVQIDTIIDSPTSAALQTQPAPQRLLKLAEVR